MSELSKDELLGQVETWLIACKHDTEGVYKNCKECPCKKSCKQAKRKIMALIKKEVTEEWIEEKAIELNNEIILELKKGNPYDITIYQKFIRSLYEEITK